MQYKDISIIYATVVNWPPVSLNDILSGDAASLPLVCWQFVVIQNQFANKTSDPVLTFARGNKIYFYQVNRVLIYKINILSSKKKFYKFKFVFSRFLWIYPTRYFSYLFRPYRYSSSLFVTYSETHETVV